MNAPEIASFVGLIGLLLLVGLLTAAIVRWLDGRPSDPVRHAR